MDRTRPKGPEDLGLSESQLAVKANGEGDNAGDAAKVGVCGGEVVREGGAVQGPPWTLAVSLCSFTAAMQCWT